ncbi:DUF4430 domain-containing protein [Moorella sp. Hama-1]|uniref:DUF4430 domain-containing protein n=1 Tax=Moorella sp. Hama-1 TaxID=2138101 RepID=UPI000D657A63|nr:DUF4430 domain-containing protein [Moorella sp. Hama-1]BCV21628.1 hypothetical protein hamaS1_16970 [Moorella sp. Hama-1]
MPKRIVYLVAALVIMAALIGPAVWRQKTASTSPAAPDTALTQSQVPSPGGNPAAGNAPENTGGQVPEIPTPAAMGKNAGDNGGTTGGKEAAPANSQGVTTTPSKASGQVNAGAAPPDGSGSNGSPAGNKNNVPSPSAPPAFEGCQVGIAVIGMKGQILFGPAAVTVNKNNKWGLTALGALDATGLKYSMSPVYGNFVQSIAGQANKGMCGWMYKVNNETPLVAASEKDVSPGDKIIWWYSESMNNPGPTWEGLKAAAP